MHKLHHERSLPQEAAQVYNGVEYLMIVVQHFSTLVKEIAPNYPGQSVGNGSSNRPHTPPTPYLESPFMRLQPVARMLPQSPDQLGCLLKGV